MFAYSKTYFPNEQYDIKLYSIFLIMSEDVCHMVLMFFVIYNQVTVQYQAKESQFHLSFGTCGASTVANCHTLVSTHLTQALNNHCSIIQLVEVRFYCV